MEGHTVLPLLQSQISPPSHASDVRTVMDEVWSSRLPAGPWWADSRSPTPVLSAELPRSPNGENLEAALWPLSLLGCG